MIACADVAIAVSTAKFALTEVRFGIVPAVISPYVVAAVGSRNARRWFLSAMTLDASAACVLGLLHQSVANDALDTAVEECLTLILQGGPIAQREAKKLIRDVGVLSSAELPQHTANLLARLRGSPEGKEGLTAFLEKRKPNWDPSS